MNPPILQLYGDIWSLVIEYLNFESISNLFMVGDSKLRSAALRSVHTALWFAYGPVMRVEGFFRSCLSMPIRSIMVCPVRGTLVVAKPKEAIQLPSTLTSLSLTFPEVFSLIVPLKLSQIVPNLVLLLLHGDSNLAILTLEDLDLPPNLETLDLDSWRSYPPLQTERVASFPRTLTVLGLRTAMTMVGPNNIAPIFDWPPALTYLRLSSNTVIVIETLPRTVTELNLEWSSLLETSFPRIENRAFFPWRRFFPRLSSLSLPQSDYNMDYSNPILKTFLLADHLSGVDEFIASGPWDLPSIRLLQPVAPNSYPLLKELSFRSCSISLSQEQNLAELAPYLRQTEFKCEIHVKRASMLPGNTHFRLSNDTIAKGDEQFPSNVRKLLGSYSVSASLLPASLTELKCRAILGKGENGNFLPGETLPPSLKHLELLLTNRRFECTPISFLHILPLSLTSITLPLSHPHDWHWVASRLINLIDLYATIQPSWSCTEPLTKISSTSLTKLHLVCNTDATQVADVPKRHEFFPSPSIFPDSLKIIALASGSWHASVITALPKNLEALNICSFTWSSKCVPYPAADGLSDEAILRCLSPRLRTLHLVGAELQPDCKRPIELIQFLPHSLSVISLVLVFSGDFSEATQFIPPYARMISMGSKAFTTGRRKLMGEYLN